ncbi:tyrosine-type recombinase/integrase [Streptomyces sp. NPDC051362]|uniref:tyrosine-type recombinase/integrase n=1 Tax=Streptomyces sp. NPDC051362 TaxID=3365651 RepID=UPI0037A2C35F
MNTADEEVYDAEIVDDGGERALVIVDQEPPLVDFNTVLYPGQPLPTAANIPRYTERDLYVSGQTAAVLQDDDVSGPVKAFKAWCEAEGRVYRPCTTATFTEYANHLMRRGLKNTTIKNYMSLIRSAMPVGKKPDASMYLKTLAVYRAKNKRVLRVKRAFPITLSYLVPMMEKAEAAGTGIGIRDAALLAFGYMFLGRSIEDANLDIEDLTILDDRVLVWVAEDKSHKDEDQTVPLRDRTDVQLVARLRRWLDYMAEQGFTTGPVFRHVLKGGKVASAETRAKVASVRGEHLRGHVINERVKHWFQAAGLVGDGRPITSHGLRAGGATDLAAAKVSARDLRKAGRWREDSIIPEVVYVRPAQDADFNPFAAVPVHDPSAG